MCLILALFFAEILICIAHRDHGEHARLVWVAMGRERGSKKVWIGESECVNVSPGCVRQSVCIIVRHGSVGVRVCVQVYASVCDVAW